MNFSAPLPPHIQKFSQLILSPLPTTATEVNYTCIWRAETHSVGEDAKEPQWRKQSRVRNNNDHTH